MISLIWSGEKYLRPASIETIFFLANFSSWVGSLAGVSVAAVAGWAATSDSATELASSRIKRSRSDTRNSRSGSVGWLWSTIGAGAVGFSTVSWEASSLGESVASPSLGWVGTVVAGLSVVVGVSAATTWAPAKNPMSTEAAPTAYFRMA